MDKKHQAFVCGYIYGYLEKTIENSKVRCIDLNSPANLNQATIKPMSVLTVALLKMNAAGIKTEREKLANLFNEIEGADLHLNIEEQGEFMRGVFSGRKPKLEKLALLRQEKGMTQKELAEKAEIPTASIAKYETGERNLRFAKAEAVQKIAEVLGCRMEDLL